VQPSPRRQGIGCTRRLTCSGVLLLRRLTEQGHAIGSIATLDAAQLQQVSLASDGKASGEGRGPARASAPAAAGGGWAGPGGEAPASGRCSTPGHAVQRVAVFESLAEAARATAGTAADLLLWHAPELRPDVPPERRPRSRRAAPGRWRWSIAMQDRPRPSVGRCRRCRDREPADDEALGTWLASMEAGLSVRAVEPAPVDTPKSAQPRARWHPAASTMRR